MTQSPSETNFRLRHPSPQNNLSFVIAGIMSATFFGIAAILAIIYLRPKEDNTALIATVIGFIAPTVTSFLALIKSMQTGSEVQELRLDVNSRLTQLLQQTAKASKAEGRDDALAAAATIAAASAAAVVPTVAAVVPTIVATPPVVQEQVPKIE